MVLACSSNNDVNDQFLPFTSCHFVPLCTSTATHMYNGSDKRKTGEPQNRRIRNGVTDELRENALALLAYNMCCIKQDELWQLASVCYVDESNW